MGIAEKIFGPQFDVVMAHAAIANKDIKLSEQRPMTRFTTLKSSSGDSLNPEDYFIVKAAGASLQSRGIEDGADLVARRVTPAILPKIAKGALVVVNGVAKDSNTGNRLRVFDGFSGDFAKFESYSDIKAPRERPASEIIGVVTHTMR